LAHATIIMQVEKTGPPAIRVETANWKTGWFPKTRGHGAGCPAACLTMQIAAATRPAATPRLMGIKKAKKQGKSNG